MSEATSPSKRRALGRGLGALIRESPTVVPLASADQRVRVTDIQPNPRQPRRFFSEDRLTELANSIRQQGVLQPLVVRKVEHGYELIVGERRWRAAQRAGMEYVPVIIKEVSDGESLEMALVENIQREELTPVEEGLAYRHLMEEFHLTQEEVAVRVGKSRPVVTTLLRLLSLPDDITEEIDRGALSVGHARVLLSVETPAQQRAIAHQIKELGLSVRATEALLAQEHPPVRALRRQPNAEPGATPDIHVKALEEELTRAFGTKVRLSLRKKGGCIEIEYYSNEELEGLLRRLRAA
jgi:ParB family transcriptional regulator, chromosome partitioning protein